MLLAVLLSCGILTGCGPNKQAEHTVAILRESLNPPPDGRTIFLGVAAGCTANRVVTAHVEESPSTIRILARAKNAYIPSGQATPLCMPGVVVHLRSPLGRRVLIDASTGKVIKPG